MLFWWSKSPPSSHTLYIKSWNWAIPCVAAVLERRQTGLGREKSSCTTELMIDAVSPKRIPGNKMVLQSYTMLDQENWNFIPPTDKLLNAHCPKKECDLKPSSTLPLRQNLTTLLTEIIAHWRGTGQQIFMHPKYAETQCLKEKIRLKP